MVEMSNRILFPSAVFRFTDNCVLVQLIQIGEDGISSGVLAENSFQKFGDAIDYYKEVIQKRKEKYLGNGKEETVKEPTPKEEEGIDFGD